MHYALDISVFGATDAKRFFWQREPAGLGRWQHALVWTQGPLRDRVRG
jgi:hypothetical protein